MGKTAKIILSIVGVFILACIVGTALFARFAKRSIEGITQETQRQVTEGRAFAVGRAQAQCVDEGLARVQRCPGISCQIAVQTFTSTCLSRAAPTPGLCEGVPHPQDFMSSAQWANGRCAPLNGPQSAQSEAARRCHNQLRVLQSHCALQRLAAGDASVLAPSDATAPGPDAP